MTAMPVPRGGETIASLRSMEPWQSELIVLLRTWCSGPEGPSDVMDKLRVNLSHSEAVDAYRAAGRLLQKVSETTYRPLVRHGISCPCVGADEALLVHLVRLASDGQLQDAALMAGLLSGPSHAEHIGILAGELGEILRRNVSAEKTIRKTHDANVVHLH